MHAHAALKLRAFTFLLHAHPLQTHVPDGLYEVEVNGLVGNFIADNITNWDVIFGRFALRFAQGKSLDYLRNLMCGNDVSSFHHVLLTFPGGLNPDAFPFGLFGWVPDDPSETATRYGMNAYVAEVKLMTELTGVCGPPPVCNPTCTSSLCFLL